MGKHSQNKKCLIKKNVVVSLGSNIENREQFLMQAIDFLNKENELVVLSSIYETSPTDFLQQNTFFNAVAVWKTKDNWWNFLIKCQAIEKKISGNEQKKTTKGPRKIDLDIILYEEDCVNEKMKENHLFIPHKNYHRRLFVLNPLRECEKIIQKEFLHPIFQKKTKQILEEGNKKKWFMNQEIKVFKKNIGKNPQENPQKKTKNKATTIG